MAGSMFLILCCALLWIQSVESVGIETIIVGPPPNQPYRLTFVNKYDGFSSTKRDMMVAEFFNSYPAINSAKNNAPYDVTFIVDPAFSGSPASASGRTITFNPTWLNSQLDADIKTLIQQQLRLLPAPETTTTTTKAPGYSSTIVYCTNNECTPYKLTFINKVEGYNSDIIMDLVITFFTVYPKMAAMYNPNTLKAVTFVMDPNFGSQTSPAGSTNGVVYFNPTYFINHPKHVDIVTHEVMHITQNYPSTATSANEGWITEGIADYVRNQFGVKNAEANWSLGSYSAGQKYTDGYGTTARFFTWLDKKVKSGIIISLNAAKYQGTYTASFWQAQTGKTVDELWAQYAANPAL